MSTKTKILFGCTECGAVANKWAGQCSACHAWNTMVEVKEAAPTKAAKSARYSGYTGSLSAVQLMAEIPLESMPRILTGLSELDRVLGGGMVTGSVILVGGDPGVGKSTIVLQTLCRLSLQLKALYVTGEESVQQVAMRAKRLELPDQELLLLAETNVERICQLATEQQPQVIVIDSIQTMHLDEVPGAPGGISQVKESAAYLTQYAKKMGISIWVVGHVTKTGDLAGPRVLEHIVDVVCYIEGNSDSRYRIIRSVKNRFGAVNEVGVFAMTDHGLKEVKNPSAIFLSHFAEACSGSVVTVIWEGTRPLLIEMQALVDESHLENPRRVTVGLEQNRLAMLLAVLHKHGGIATYGQDIFVNVVGGVRVTETSADLAVVMAVVSSYRDTPLPKDMVVLGEIGLAGEIRPVPNGQERLREAAKHGFKRAIAPKTNVPKAGISGMEIISVEKLADALEAM